MVSARTTKHTFPAEVCLTTRVMYLWNIVSETLGNPWLPFNYRLEYQ
jgi:hypothetical protein